MIPISFKRIKNCLTNNSLNNNLKKNIQSVFLIFLFVMKIMKIIRAIWTVEF